MRRALLFCVAIAFAIACGDDITEPIPDRTVATPPTVAFATTTSDNGLSITTDKDDYAPGDTVHFTGTGWNPGDALDIALVDDAVTQETHTWSVSVGEDGTFHDSTYIVDTEDVGVTFTLTATDAITGQSLTVTFTDGTLVIQATTNQQFSPNGDNSKDEVTISVRNSGAPQGTLTGGVISIRRGTGLLTASPQPELIKTLSVGSLAQNATANIVWDGKNVGGSIETDGLYTARVFSTVASESQPEGDVQNRKVVITLDRTAPVLTNVAVVPALSNGGGGNFKLSAIATDALTNIVSASYKIDGGSAVAMDATDHAFDELAEDVDAMIPSQTVKNLTEGPHQLCVTANDLAGNPNSASCTTLLVDLSDPTVTVNTIASGTVGTPMTITGTATDPGTNPSGVASVSVAITGTGTANLTATNTGTNFSTWSASFTPSVAGNYTATAAAKDNANNSGNSAGRNFTVNPVVVQAATTLVVTPATGVFGGTVDLSATLTSGTNLVSGKSISFKLNGVAACGITGKPDCPTTNPSGVAELTGASLTGINATTYPNGVSASFAGDATHAAANGAADLTVDQAGQAITFDLSSLEKRFGDADFSVASFAAGGGSGNPVTFASTTPSKCTVLADKVTVHIVEAGTCEITASQAGNNNYKAADDVTRSFEVQQVATTTGLASSKSPSTYGEEITFTATVKPAVSGTSLGSVDFKKGASLLESVTLGNCTTTECTATLKLANLTAVGSPHSITAVYSGNVNFLSSTSAAVSQTVHPATLSGKVANASRPYGSPNPTTFSATYTGFVLGESDAILTGTLTCVVSATVSSPVVGSPYAIDNCSGVTAPNYTLTFVPGELTVTRAPLTVKAQNKQKTYDGQAFSPFTVEFSGFVLDEDATVLGGALAFSGTAGGAVNAGSYTIIPGGLTSTNYEIKFENGTLTIDPRPITIKGNDAGPIYYDDPLPTFTWSIVTGNFIGSDQAAFASTVTFQLSSPGSPLAVGPHTITPVWTYNNSNYAISLANPGTGTITVQAWTISGFYQPVDMSAGGNVWNTVRGGYTVPLKFEVFAGTNEKTNVAAVKSFTAIKCTCPNNAVTDDIEITTTGGTSLRYDLSAGQFVQNWQTPKPANTCYKVTMGTLDGSSITAFFMNK
jgi:hypothetical protein